MKNHQKLNKLVFLVIAMFLIMVPATAEEIPGEDGKVEGKVYDEGSDQPVEFANVIIFNPSDSSMVTGGLSDMEGIFRLKNIPYGDYYMTIDFIGYKKRVISPLEITPKNKNIDLGTILLGVTAVELSAATITAEKMAMEYKIDRKVINVDQDLDAVGNSAVQILEKAPSIRVDISGEVFLRGSSNFTVLIDGKPSVLTGSEALQQIPASTIESIEIITNPSVKYDPDGTAGIINIVMKKNRLSGLAGVANATIGTNDKYAADLYLNYKTGNLNFFGGLDWNDRRFPWTGDQIRETYTEDTTFYKESFGDGAWLRSGVKFRGGFDYTPNDKTTYSFGGEYGNFGFGMDNFIYITEYTNPDNGVRRYINDDKRRWKRDYYSLNGTFKRDFNGEGHNLTMYAFYSNRDGYERQDKIEYDTDADWNSIDEFPLLVRTDESGPSDNFRFEADYTRPVGASGKIEAGYRFRFDQDREGNILETWDYDFGEWVEDPNYTKNTEYRRDIHAIYGIYSSSFKSLQYQVGLRGEYTYRNLEVINTGESSLIDRFDYFPSIHVSNRFNEKNQMMASYSRRIDRPRGWYLEPFESYIDEDTRRIGNPDLLPEYTDSYEIGYLRTLQAGNVSLDAYYRRTNNKITTIQTVDPETGILTITNENLNNDQALGVEGSFMYDFTDWFNLNLSGTYFNYRLDDRRGDENDISSSNNWNVRAISSFKIPTQTRVQVNMSYESPTVSAQGRLAEQYFMDLTIRQDFLNKQLNVTLRISDVFGTRQQIEEIWGPNFYVYDFRQREIRMTTITLSYRLNNFKDREERVRDSGGGM